MFAIHACTGCVLGRLALAMQMVKMVCVALPVGRKKMECCGCIWFFFLLKGVTAALLMGGQKIFAIGEGGGGGAGQHCT